jgi:hypothetical protein
MPPSGRMGLSQRASGRDASASIARGARATTALRAALTSTAPEDGVSAAAELGRPGLRRRRGTRQLSSRFARLHSSFGSFLGASSHRRRSVRAGRPGAGDRVRRVALVRRGRRVAIPWSPKQSSAVRAPPRRKRSRGREPRSPCGFGAWRRPPHAIGMTRPRREPTYAFA